MTENVIQNIAARFRTCSVTGLKVDKDAETLIKLNAVVAVVAMLIGATAALLLVLTRWQAVHLLNAEWYYRLLTAHGLNMLIFFIIFFEMAILYFAGPVLLNCRLPMPKFGYVNFALMVIGFLMVDVEVFRGKADVLFTSYVPLRAEPAYYLGIILFAVGTLLTTCHFLAVLVVAQKEKTYSGSMPLTTFGALTAAIIAVITLLHGAAIFVPTFLWSLGLMDIDPQVYRVVFWALGHSTQQINVSAHVAVWYMMAGLTVGGVVPNEKISRIAYALYILFISMASAHHLLVDPGMGPAWKVWNTSYAMYLAVFASMIHGFTVPASVELGQRLNGYTKGRFEWLVKAPWSDPGFAGFFLSVIIFGFGGGITGVTIGTEQINIIGHNTLKVPGHFHVTVVGGTALAFMAVTYYVLPLIFRKKVAFWGMAKWQPWFFGIGISIMGSAQTFLGSMGVPRRHWDITFQGAPFTIEFPAATNLFFAAMGIGGIIAATGAFMYIAIAVVTVFFGATAKDEDFKPGVAGIPQGLGKLPKQSYTIDPEFERAGTPGTVVLVGIFLACFALYYFVNWQALSFVWKVG